MAVTLNIPTFPEEQSTEPKLLLREDGEWVDPTSSLTVDTPEANAEGREVVNAYWVRRYIKNLNVSGVTQGSGGSLGDLFYGQIVSAARDTTNYPNGTIITYKDHNSLIKKFYVADAKYRSIARFGTYGLNASLTDTIYTGTTLSWHIAERIDSITNETYKDVYSECVDSGTAQTNCDEWAKYATNVDNSSLYPYEDGIQNITGVPAVNWCRNIKVNNEACNLPNIQQLLLIYVWADVIDSLDPTVANASVCTCNNAICRDCTDCELMESCTQALSNRYLQFALGTRNPNGYFNIYGYNGAWSSTEFNNFNCRVMYSDGTCGYHYKCSVYGVIPVLEIN